MCVWRCRRANIYLQAFIFAAFAVGRCEWTCVVCACEHAFVLVWRQQSYTIYFAVRCVSCVRTVCVCVFVNKLNKRTDYLLSVACAVVVNERVCAVRCARAVCEQIICK